MGPGAAVGLLAFSFALLLTIAYLINLFMTNPGALEAPGS